MGAALSFLWSGMIAWVAGMYPGIAGGPDHNVTSEKSVTSEKNVMTPPCPGTSAAQDQHDQETADCPIDKEKPRRPVRGKQPKPTEEQKLLTRKILNTGLMHAYENEVEWTFVQLHVSF